MEKIYNELLDQVSTVLFNSKNKSEGSTVVVNTLGWKRTEVISLDDKGQSPSKKQRSSTENTATQIDSFGNTLGKKYYSSVFIK